MYLQSSHRRIQSLFRRIPELCANPCKWKREIRMREPRRQYLSTTCRLYYADPRHIRYRRCNCKNQSPICSSRWLKQRLLRLGKAPQNKILRNAFLMVTFVLEMQELTVTVRGWSCHTARTLNYCRESNCTGIPDSSISCDIPIRLIRGNRSYTEHWLSCRCTSRVSR